MKSNANSLRDHNLCFYGHGFGKAPKLSEEVAGFLREKSMKICPPVRSGEWLWKSLLTAMRRCAFCIFECGTRNPNAHIELGYALANGLPIILLVPESTVNDKDEITSWLPSDLAGLIQLRYSLECEVNQKLSDCVPAEWYSVEQRLWGLLQMTTRLERAYLEALLRRPADIPISFSDLFLYPNGKRIEGTSNNAVMDFVGKFDEILKIPVFGMYPPDYESKIWKQGETEKYDAWEPRSDVSFGSLTFQIAPEYRRFVADALGIAIDDIQ